MQLWLKTSKTHENFHKLNKICNFKENEKLMANPLTNDKNKLSNLQIEFLKSLKYMATEEQLSDIRSLLRHYFANQLDSAIQKVEEERGYSATIYESWLRNKNAAE